MVVKDIFVINESQGLYAVHWQGEEKNAFAHFFTQMADAIYLVDFFDDHEDDLTNHPQVQLSKTEAVLKVKNDAKALQKAILNAESFEELDYRFQPLSDNERVNRIDLRRQKCYGIVINSFLRLYAVRFDEGQYLITGGTIKLTRALQEREHTQIELNKLDHIVNYLIDEGIFELPE